MTHNVRRILVSAMLGLAFAVVSIAHAAGADKALAVVNGKAITEAEVRTAKAAELAALEVEQRKNRHAAIESGLDELVNRDMIDAEAAARGVTHAQIVAGVKPTAVTDADVDAFYEANKGQIPKPKNEVVVQIRQYLEQMAQKQADDDFIAAMKTKYKVAMNLEPLRIDVAATGPADGPANAPVTLVEFSDFQCPFCGRLFPTLTAVKAKYGDKLRIVFRHFPLTKHTLAPKAAEAALCADAQGMFWKMHDAMFKNQRALKVADLKASAAELGMDSAKFDTCLDSGRTAATVQSDLDAGRAVGIDGTPAMFINGRQLDGAVPLEQIAAIVDDELQRAGHPAAAAAPSDGTAVLAVVNGKSITEADVLAAKATALEALSVEHARNLDALIRSGLDELVNRDLIDAEAAARGVSHAELVAGIKPGPVTDADIDKFYEENKAQIPTAKEQALGQIRKYLEDGALTTAQDGFLASLRAKYKVEMKLEPLRIAVEATGPANGPTSAPVTVVEFADFQCPFSFTLFPALTTVKAKYGDKVRIVFRQFPIDSHPFAAKAAEASLCANEQGKFWQMHDAMFKDQKALGIDDLKKTAAAIGLDAAAFALCLDSGKTAATVRSDFTYGSSVGVAGTPAMFINGRFLSGALPVEDISRIVDEELRLLGK